MNIRFLVMVFGFLSLMSNVNAQDKWIKHRFTYKVGGGRIHGFHEKGTYNIYETDGEFVFSVTDKTYSKSAYVEMSATYGVSRWLELGLYGGVGFFHRSFVFPVPFYGINANVQLMPLLLDVQNYRLDLYVATEVGGLYTESLEGGFAYIASEDYNMLDRVEAGHKTEAGIGLGGAFYLTRRIGVYSEFKVGQYVSVNKFRWIYGVTFKF